MSSQRHYNKNLLSLSKGRRFIALLLFVAVAPLLLNFSIPSGSAVASQTSGYWPSYRAGVVMTRNLVRGENGQPIIAEFAEDGSVIQEYGEAVNRLENAYTMSGDVYRAFVQAHNDFLNQYGNSDAKGSFILSREAYENYQFTTVRDEPVQNAPDGAKPELLAPTKSVRVRNTTTILTTNTNPVLFEAAIDLSDLRDLDNHISAVLLNEKGQVLYTSEHNIGYRVAILKPKNDESTECSPGYDFTQDHERYRDPSKDDACGPISDALITTNVFPGREGGTFSDHKGKYSLSYMNLPCPGFDLEYTNSIIPKLFYSNYNPKSSRGTGLYYQITQVYDWCFGSHELLKSSGNLGGLSAYTSVVGILATRAEPSRQLDIFIDVIALTGTGTLGNSLNATEAIPLGDQTVYETNLTPFIPVVPESLDLDGDRQTDETKLFDYDQDGNEEVGVYLGGKHPDDVDDEGNPIAPDLIREPDYIPDTRDQGLLKTISQTDLEESDLYVFRVSNDQLIFQRKGLDPDSDGYVAGQNGGVLESDTAGFYYNSIMRGPQSNGTFFRQDFETWQSKVGMDPDFYEREADHLRTGEQIKLVAVNRRTGYIGTVTTTVGNAASNGSGKIDFPIDQIILRPPNLKVKVERIYEVEAGLTKGQARKYLVGFEGTGLDSDKVIALSTEWYDHDGTPLPDGLEGYTGRIAKIIDNNNTLGNIAGDNVAEFPIKPGQRMQFLRLANDTALSNDHYYVHVSGEPKEGNPDFQTLGAGEGVLQYRPKHYVPVRVPILDEIETRKRRNAARYAVEDGIIDNTSVASVYAWPYRPEMQFSVFDLKISEISAETRLSETEQSATRIDVGYDLEENQYNPLPRFGPNRDLILALNDSEVGTAFGIDQNVSFNDTELLQSLAPESYLALQLYQSDDVANILYEYTGLPVLMSAAREIGVKRTYMLGTFNAALNNAGNTTDITDNYELFPFFLNDAAKVSVKILDENGDVRKTLISSTQIAPGAHLFTLTYQDVYDASILPRAGVDFYIEIEAIVSPINEPTIRIDVTSTPTPPFVNHTVRFPGEMIIEYTGENLGQIVQSDVLIQEGALTLNHEDINLPGLGPSMVLSRSYSNRGSEKDQVFGQGWSHNLDITISALAYLDSPTEFNLPAWVNESRGKFFRQSSVPDTDPPLTLVAVSNGGMFKKSGNNWYPQRGYHGTLNQTENGFDYRSKDGTLYSFDYPHRPVAQQPVRFIEDRNGNRMTLSYELYRDSFGRNMERLVEITDAINRKLKFYYALTNGGERITQVMGPDGIEVNYTYDDEGLLSTASRDTYSQAYTYAQEPVRGNYNLTTVTDPNGNTQEYVYHEEGSVPNGLFNFVKALNPEDVIKEVIYPDNIAKVQLAYNVATANERVVTDARGNDTTYTLNFFGNPTKIEEPLGKTTSMTWSIDEGEDDNVVTSRKDALGREWEYEYDVKGNVTTETDPYNKETVSTWDPQFSVLLTRIDRNNNEISNTYDSKGNLITHTDGERKETHHSYLSNGLLETTTSPRGFDTDFTYDGNGFPATVTGPEGSKTKTAYDIRGRLRSSIDPNNNDPTLYEYDSLDRLTSRTDPDSYGVSFTYDNKGNKASEKSRWGVVLAYSYDKRDRVVDVQRSGPDLPPASMSYSYDPNSNLTSETDWKNIPSSHIYDDLNRRISTKNRAGDDMSMGYDLVGNKTSEIDYEGKGTTFKYDDLDRLTQVINAHGDSKFFDYDLEKSVLSETDEEGRITNYQYDKRYLRTKRINTQPFTDEYLWAYDDSGNLISETNENGALITYSYDKQERQKTISRYPDDTTVYVTTNYYDANGNITKVEDARNNTVETTYDELNRPLVITDQEDEPTSTTYLDGGQIVSVIDARGISRITNFDALNRVSSQQAGDGGIVRFKYDANDNVTQNIDARNTVSKTEYDTLDRPIQVTLALGLPEVQIHKTVYDKVGNVTAKIDGRNNPTRYTYDDLHRLKTTINAKLDDSINDYDKVGNLTSVIDFRENLTSYEYDELNRLTKTTDALPVPKTIVLTYDKVGNVKTEKDKRNTVTTHSYDDLNRLLNSQKPDGNGNTVILVRNEYDGNNNLTAVIDANDNRTEHSYTRRNQLDVTTFADTTTISRSYDTVGNQLTETDEADQTVTFTYDNENRLASQTNHAQETTSFLYDKNGNQTSITKPIVANGTSILAYDKLNRLSSITDPLNNVTQYKYDAANNMVTQIDAENETVEYLYDELNRRTNHIQKKPSGDLTVAYGYDENGNRTSLTDAKGQLYSYSYDEINRETLRSYPVVSGPYIDIQSIATSYDANNNVTAITETKAINGGGTLSDVTSNSYDLLDRLQTSTQRGKTISYNYDPNGNRTAVSTNAGSTSYTFDNRNRLKTATVGSDTTTYDYVSDGKLNSVSYPNGTLMTNIYDDADRNTQVKTTLVSDNSIISQLDYSYDANGNRLTQNELQNGVTDTTSYDYDAADRMTSFALTESTGTVTTTTYTLDNVSNRITEVVAEDNTTTTDKTYHYDDTHWLTQVSDELKNQNIDYTYDANGNTIQKVDNTLASPESTLFSYDTRDQLVQVIRGPPNSETNNLGQFDYNYQGLRVRHANSSRGDVTYFYDGQSVLEERDDTDNLLAHYRYADRLLSLDTGTQVQYYHHDALGSTTNLTDTSGNQQVSYKLDPWGHIREQQGESVNRQIFTGQEHDENTGLIYFGARYYDADSGRFITQDSYLGEVGAPPSLHRYLYAYANPTVFIDRFGNFGENINHIRDFEQNSMIARSAAADIDNQLTGDLIGDSHLRLQAIGLGTIGALNDLAGNTLDKINFAGNIVISRFSDDEKILREMDQSFRNVDLNIAEFASSAKFAAKDITNNPSNLLGFGKHLVQSGAKGLHNTFIEGKGSSLAKFGSALADNLLGGPSLPMKKIFGKFEEKILTKHDKEISKPGKEVAEYAFDKAKSVILKPRATKENREGAIGNKLGYKSLDTTNSTLYTKGQRINYAKRAINTKHINVMKAPSPILISEEINHIAEAKNNQQYSLSLTNRVTMKDDMPKENLKNTRNKICYPRERKSRVGNYPRTRCYKTLKPDDYPVTRSINLGKEE